MELDPALYCLEIRPDLRMVPQGLDLARYGFIDMLLKCEHVGDIAVDGVRCTAHCSSVEVRTRTYVRDSGVDTTAVLHANDCPPRKDESGMKVPSFRGIDSCLCRRRPLPRGS